MSDIEKLLILAAIDNVVSEEFGYGDLITENQRTLLALRTVELVAGKAESFDDLRGYYVEIGQRLVSELLPEEADVSDDSADIEEETEDDANHSES